MLKLGLTGGIASGKSAVAAMLRDLNFPVLSADLAAHKMMEPGQPAHHAILEYFGPAVATSDNQVDRSKLASIVFADPRKLARLNAILHPLVEKIMLQQFAEWEHTGKYAAAFVEAALLVEAGFHKHLDGLVVVWCEPAQQIERLRARGMSELDAKRRIAAQLPLEEKIKHANYTIDCSGSIAKTLTEVQALAARLNHPG